MLNKLCYSSKTVEDKEVLIAIEKLRMSNRKEANYIFWLHPSLRCFL